MLLVGATASGKSALAVALAHAVRERTGVPALIITADAYQVYRGMDIGTAKPTPAERQGVEHALIDIADPHDPTPFTASTWLSLARAQLDACRAQGRPAIVVGGTHLYAKLLLDGMFEGPAADPAVRERLMAMDAPARRALLERVDPAAAARIHPNDLRRTVRALEVFELTGKPISAHQRQWDAPSTQHPDSPPALLLAGLDWPVAPLNARINERVRAMLRAGLLDEVRSLRAKGPLNTQAREALGYKQLLTHLDRTDAGLPSSLDDAVEQIKILTRRFAKNQRTWLRRLRTTPASVWCDGTQGPAQAADRILSVWLGPPQPEQGKPSAKITESADQNPNTSPET